MQEEAKSFSRESVDRNFDNFTSLVVSSGINQYSRDLLVLCLKVDCKEISSKLVFCYVATSYLASFSEMAKREGGEEERIESLVNGEARGWGLASEYLKVFSSDDAEVIAGQLNKFITKLSSLDDEGKESYHLKWLTGSFLEAIYRNQNLYEGFTELIARDNKLNTEFTQFLVAQINSEQIKVADDVKMNVATNSASYLRLMCLAVAGKLEEGGSINIKHQIEFKRGSDFAEWISVYRNNGQLGLQDMAEFVDTNLIWK